MAFGSSDIVLKNRIVASTGPHAGIHGTTPGRYILRYMARSGANEYVALTGPRPYDYATRYMTRRQAVSDSGTISVALDETGAEHPMHDYFLYSGVGFGSWQSRRNGRLSALSMTDQQIREASRQVQDRFDQGHDVSQLVVSFRGSYLERMGVLDGRADPPRGPDGRIDDEAIKEREERTGAATPYYRGHVDQAKLRAAIMAGLQRSGLTSAGLTYVGTIHVNTGNVHAHLLLAFDRRSRSGTEGWITEKQMYLMRRGIDNSLDDSLSLQATTAAISEQRTDLVSAVSDWAVGLGAGSASLQQLAAVMPEDQRLWHAGSRSPAMRRPNAVAARITEEVINGNPATYDMWYQSVLAYIDERRRREGRINADRLMREARRRLFRQCANALYDRIRQLKRDRDITPMMRVMRISRSRIREELAARDGNDRRSRLLTFALRARNYSQRLDEHIRLQRAYVDRAAAFRRYIIMADGPVGEQVLAVDEFYHNEVDYQMRCVCKYRHFLAAHEDTEPWRARYEREIMPRMADVQRIHAMLADTRFDDFDESQADEAQLYAWRTYRVENGDLMLTQRGRALLRNRTAALYELNLDTALAALRADAAGHGIIIDDDGNVTRGEPYDFDDVRGVDLQDLTQDSVHDQKVGSQAFEQFRQAVSGRVNGLQALIRYSDSIAEHTRMTGETAAAREPVAHDILAAFRTWQEMSAQQRDGRGERVLHAEPGSDEAARRQEEELVRTMPAMDAAMAPDEPDVSDTILKAIRRDASLAGGGAPGQAEEGREAAPDRTAERRPAPRRARRTPGREELQ